jgi:hypothetical protein
MKQALLALAAVAMLTAGSIAAANAQGGGMSPGGPGVSPGGGAAGQPRNMQGGTNCRTVITHRTNAMGHSVTVRRRICS